jgi:hypothetical protein
MGCVVLYFTRMDLAGTPSLMSSRRTALARIVAMSRASMGASRLLQ